MVTVNVGVEVQTNVPFRFMISSYGKNYYLMSKEQIVEHSFTQNNGAIKKIYAQK